jgi:hypothetical protein
MIGGPAAAEGALSGMFTGFSQANSDFLGVMGYPDLHTGERDHGDASRHEIPLSSARAIQPHASRAISQGRRSHRGGDSASGPGDQEISPAATSVSTPAPSSTR